MPLNWTEVLSASASAISTALAAVASILAYRGVKTAWRSFEVQSRQLSQSVELRTRDQASKFCVWFEQREDSWIMMMHNASDLPIYNVYVMWSLDDPATWVGTIGEVPGPKSGERVALLGDWQIGNVGPTLKARRVDGAAAWLRKGVAGCLDDLSERFHDLLFAPGFETAFSNICLRTYFTDASGVRWERSDGRLARCEALTVGDIEPSRNSLASVAD